jgi:LPXTG-site transpeptidase (sortase) family protein
MAKKPKSIVIGRIVIVVIGIGLVCSGGYLLYTALQPKQPILQAPLAVVKASTEKKTAPEKARYSVPPSNPRELVIPKLNIDANILPENTTKGVLNSPSSAWDVGWYAKSGLPGAGYGAMLIDGHVNDALGSPGIFYSLTALNTGDALQIERGDGRVFSYSVTLVQDIPLSQVDMSKMLVSADSSKEGLNLITCGGTYDYTKDTYDHRILVFAVRST